MKILHVGCGATRPQGEEWVNVDQLKQTLQPGTPERAQLDSEANYVEANLLNPLPFRPDTFDCSICSHVIEHFDCMQGVFVMNQIYDVLKPGGILLVSVPDASYFRKVYPDDTPDKAVELFGEPIHLPDGEQTFFGYALWNRYHKAILTEDALFCYFMRAGFTIPAQVDAAVLGSMTAILNRRRFSVEMMGQK